MGPILRTDLFFTVCIPTRFLVAFLGPPRAIAAVVGGTWVGGLFNHGVGFFGGRAWWANERWMHGVLWLAYAASGRKEWLVSDALFGVANYAKHKTL